MNAARKSNRASAGNRKALIIKVHVAKRQLGLDKDDTTYRALLQGATGKDSCADMNVAELADVLNAFVRAGWKPAPAKIRKQPKGSSWVEVPKDAPLARQKRKALALASDLGWSLDYLNGRLRQQFGVEHILWLDSQDAMQTLLKDMANRAKRRGLDAYPERRA